MEDTAQEKVSLRAMMRAGFLQHLICNTFPNTLNQVSGEGNCFFRLYRVRIELHILALFRDTACVGGLARCGLDQCKQSGLPICHECFEVIGAQKRRVN